MTKGVRIRITKEGIYGAQGEIPVGTEMDLSEEPTAWAGRYEVLSDKKGKEAVTNPAPTNEGGASTQTQTDAGQPPAKKG